MVANPKISVFEDGVSANSLALRITELVEAGDPSGGPTREQVVVQGIIGSPEGRSVGSPGDLRVQKDVPAIWQKITGIRSEEGWALIAGGVAGTLCPSNIINVGPDCQFTQIQPAIDFAATLVGPGPALVQVAPGTYAEDLTLRAFVGLQGIGENSLVTIFGTVSLLGDEDGSVRLQDLTIIPVAGPALIIRGSSQLLLEGQNLDIQGAIDFTNNGAGSSLSLHDSLVTGAGPVLIAFAGSATAVLDLDDTNVFVSAPSTNTGIRLASGQIIAQYCLFAGLIDLLDGTEAAMLFCRIDGGEQECMLIGAGSVVTADVCDFHSNNASGSVIAGGGGSINFSNLSLSGSAKDYTGAASTDQSEAYEPGDGGDWAGASPLTVKEALDRIAAAVAGLLGGPIP